MKTLTRRAALALVITIAAVACTPAQMAAWLEKHDREVPEDEAVLEALADFAGDWWVATAEAKRAEAAATPGWPWNQLVICEASGDWHISTGNGYYGGLQFAHSTWIAYGGQTYAAYAHQATPMQQVEIAQRVVDSHGGTYGAWPGCRAKLGLP